MKILFIGYSSSIHVQRYVNYFKNKGHDIALFSFERNYDRNNYGFKMFQPFIPIFNIGFPFIKKLITSFLIKYYIKKFKPDIIHAYDLKLYGNAAALCRERPLLLSLVGSDILIHSQRPLTKIFCKHSVNFADYMIASSKDIKKTALLLNPNSKKISVNYIGINFDDYLPESVDKNELRKELGLIEDSIIILCTRGFGIIYGQIYQIWALREIVKKHPNIQYVFAGEGETLEIIKKQVIKFKLEKNVKFVGWLSKKNLAKYLRAADIYVSTTLSDAISLSTMEAMYNKLPVVVFNVGGVQEWIENNKNGFLIKKKDVKQLSRILLNLIEDEKLRLRVGIQAKKIVELKGNFKKNTDKIEQIYFKLFNHVKKYR
ncbi:MAG: glycosyltransferase family 1 protein [Candidatus Lokiarchaeota archaeon]|nr:glycosyltransferase family 1 protein [Candidatus Lokiarchaeota archaeon]